MINPFSSGMNEGLREAKSLAAVMPDFKHVTARHTPKTIFNRQRPRRPDIRLSNFRPTGQGPAVRIVPARLRSPCPRCAGHARRRPWQARCAAPRRGSGPGSSQVLPTSARRPRGASCRRHIVCIACRATLPPCHQTALTAIRRGCAWACFGMRSVSTPSFRLASIRVVSSSRLSVKLRR